jgi:hypothetical protein
VCAEEIPQSLEVGVRGQAELHEYVFGFTTAERCPPTGEVEHVNNLSGSVFAVEELVWVAM